MSARAGGGGGCVSPRTAVRYNRRVIYNNFLFPQPRPGSPVEGVRAVNLAIRNGRVKSLPDCLLSLFDLCR